MSDPGNVVPASGRKFLTLTFVAAVAMTAAAFAEALTGDKWSVPPQIVIFGAGAIVLTGLPLAFLRRTPFDPDSRRCC